MMEASNFGARRVLSPFLTVAAAPKKRDNVTATPGT